MIKTKFIKLYMPKP